MPLSPAERTRYSRHLLLGQVGVAGQERLKAAKVLLLGAGGLGSPVSLYLAAAGVGTIGLVDHDRVDLSNLQRQILYSETDTGALKAERAARRLTSLNSEVSVEVHGQRFTPENAASLLSGYDLLIDGTDNFPTRYLASDACVLAGKPYIYGSVYRFEGQASVFYPPRGPCYRCLFPTPPPKGEAPSCAEAGVLGVLPGQIGMIQATEALKHLLGIGTGLIGRLMTYDALEMRFDEFKISRDPACPACGTAPSITSLRYDVEETCDMPDSTLMSAEAYEAMRLAGTEHQLIDVRSAAEAEVCKIPGSVLIPLGELTSRLDEVRRDVPVVVHCKVGGRSARAVAELQRLGITQVRDLGGGILAWIDVAAPHLPKY